MPTLKGSADSETGGMVEPLTPREQEVLELLAEGLPNKAIAARLGISDQTVKFQSPRFRRSLAPPTAPRPCGWLSGEGC